MVQQDDTFYDFLKTWYDSTKYNVNDTGEGGKNCSVERLEKLWLPRLSPTGDASVAAESFINYSLEFQPMTSTYSPNWHCLGPTSLPVNGQGIGRMHRIEFDPFYNDSTNQVIYASSGFGGLWRTLNNGASW